jgi:hypothetical protein
MTGTVVVGQRAVSVVGPTSSSERAAASALSGRYSSSRNSSSILRPRMPPARFWASNARRMPFFISMPRSWLGPVIGALMPMRSGAADAFVQTFWSSLALSRAQTSPDPHSSSEAHARG